MSPKDDGPAFEPTRDMRLAMRVVGRKYRLLRHLGEGGMGAVYEAEHLELGSKVAVKLLSFGVAADQRSIARFHREARATAAIKHENIVKVFDAGADTLGPFIVMELLEGESLSSLLHRERILAPDVAVEIALQMLAGLTAAHEHKVIHRDLKPSNVLLCHNTGGGTRVKVLDFGVSKYADASEPPAVTTTGDVIGTPRYMSPEQASGLTDVDQRTDLYTVGVLLYLMVTGQFPHQGETRDEVIQKVIAGEARPPRAIRPELPEALEQVIMKAMAREREQRYADGPEMIAALRAAMPATAPAPARPSTEPIARAPARRRRWLVPAAAAAALLVAGGLVLRQRGVIAGDAPLKLGITRYSTEARIRAEFESLTQYLGERVGRKVDLVILDYGVDAGSHLVAGDLDLAALPPYLYIRAKARAPDLRILATPASDSGTSYEGVILARAGTGITKVEDLAGKSFCYVEETSSSGYLYPRVVFRRHGIDPDKAFRTVRFKGTHLDTLKALAAGECDGAAVFADMLHDADKLGIPPDQFVTLAATPRIPYDPYCVSSHVPRELADKLEAALLALVPGSDVARRVFSTKSNFVGFTRATDADYDRVRAIQELLDVKAPR
jgi:eukaryotic-like serine/threonine-protein kinase